MENMMAMMARLALVLFIWLLVCVVACMRIFKKAGHSQLLAIIPIVNICILAQIAGKPIWMGLIACFALLIPTVAGEIISLVMWILIMHGLSLRFGKSGAFTAGLILLPGVFHCILAFGSAQYLKPEKEGDKELEPV
mgnify:CR=1 FL=1|jgi:hypothetical protein|tara:strand:+ start:103 stop:513 length:411 start_codon:yes stop_codon:yes gene_type:complete